MGLSHTRSNLQRDGWGEQRVALVGGVVVFMSPRATPGGEDVGDCSVLPGGWRLCSEQGDE